MIKVALKNGETLAYDKFGNGEKTLVLIHGNMSSSKMFDTIIERLEDTFTIYAIDLRGFGESSYNNEFWSLRELAEDLKLLFDEINLRDFYLLGWSTGGGVCMEFVSSNPDYVKGLILYESISVHGYPYYEFDENGGIIDAFGKPVPYLARTKDEMKIDKKMQSTFTAIRNQDKEPLRHIWNLLIFNNNQPEPERYDFYLGEMLKQRNTLDITYSLLSYNVSDTFSVNAPGNNRAALIKCPVLILQGEDDIVTPPKCAELNHKCLKTSELVYIKSGHCPQVDAPDEASAEIKKFILAH